MNDISGAAFGIFQYFNTDTNDDKKAIPEESLHQKPMLSSSSEEESRNDCDKYSVADREVAGITGEKRSADKILSNVETFFSQGIFNNLKASEKKPGPTSKCSVSNISESMASSCLDDDSSMDTDKSELRDEHGFGKGVNVLHYRITSANWSEVSKILTTPQGKIMASKPHPDGYGDYPLHLILDFQVDLQARAKAMGLLEQRRRREQEKIEAREDRNRRRIEGEDVDTVYDSDEWTSSESEDESDDDNESVDEENEPPPADVILKLVEAYPEACKTRGYGGRYPLHHAIRMMHSKDVVEAVLRKFPQALNIQDNQKKTPKDYYENEDDEDPDTPQISAILDRPTSCWIQTVRDDEIGDSLDKDLDVLETEIEDLMKEYAAVVADGQKIQYRVSEIERTVGNFHKFRDSQDLDVRVQELQGMLNTELMTMTEQVETLIRQAENKYADDERERKYIAGFNEDIEKIYENARQEMEELKSELADIKICFR